MMIYTYKPPHYRASPLVPIPEYDGYYVGSDGCVYSRKSKFLKVLALDYNANGYPRVKLYNEMGPRYFLVHRLVAEAFCKKPKGAKYVDHVDTNIENNHASNLRWCMTMAENLANPISVEKRMKGIRTGPHPRSVAGKRAARLAWANEQAKQTTPF